MKINKSSILTKEEKKNQQSESKVSNKVIDNINTNNIPNSSLNINPETNENQENNEKVIEELD